MTTALVTAVNNLDDLPAEPGVSPRAVRTVLRVYAKIAQSDGSFKYGLRGSKVAALADYSLATVRRVQRYLVTRGYLEKIQVGGGRASTRWRVVVEKLGLRHGSRPAVTPQPDRGDTGQGREPKRLGGMLSRWRPGRDHHPGGQPPPSPSEPAAPSRAAAAAAPGSRVEAMAMDWAAQAGAFAPQVFEVCEPHGGRAGRMPSGLPWCPDCRRLAQATGS